MDQNKKSVKKSTKTTDRGTALRMAFEWEHIENLARQGSASVAAFQKVVDQVSQKVIGETMPSQTVREYFTEWLKVVARKSAPGTHERYANTARLFLKSLGHAADQPLRAVAPRHIEQFLGNRLDDGAAPKTAIVDIKTLGSALRRAENFGFIDKNPVPAVKLPKAVSSERAVFTPDEVNLLVQGAPNEDWQTLIMIAIYTGARMSDCLAMTWDNVDSGQKLLVYSQRKTGKMVATPIHVDLLIHLGRLSQKSAVGPLCRSLSTKNQSGKHGLSEGFKRIVMRAGLDLMKVKGKGTRNFSRRTFHSLRHSFSSMLANAGVSEEMRMKLTGHSSRDIHQKYTHIDVGPLQKAIESMPMNGQVKS
ncbi:MAG: tyrosine-type recombinase/integrase [Verrucomicrobiales bacterium]